MHQQHQIYTSYKNKMKAQRYLSLCDPHNGIIHEFGYDGSCTKVAAICIRGCNEHDHILKNSKHQFINAREFYSLVQELREKYKHFKINFREVYLKKYLSMVYNLVDSFEDHINNQYLEKTPLIDIFCKYSSERDVFQQLIEEKVSEMDFSELKCKEINQIKNFERAISKQSKEQQQKRMIKLLSKVFQHYLVSNKILCNDKNVYKSTHEVIEEEKLSKVYKELQKKLKNFQLSRNQSKITNLILKIKEENETIQQSFNNEEFREKFCQKLKKYIEKTSTQKIQLSCNISLIYNRFWQRFFSILASQTSIKAFTLITSASDKSSKIFQSQIKKSMNIPFHLEVKYESKWLQQKQQQKQS